MLGIIVQLAISWLIIWLWQRGSLSVLGLRPTSQRIIDFILFFLLTSTLCASGFLLKMYFGQQWKLNPDLTFNMVLTGIWWNIKSVLFEELIFRGVLLYILIRKFGALTGIIISAIAFGIYHWFSFGVIGNAMAMLITFITTGIMGLLLAYGYSKTFSLFVPIAIHLGWNFTQIFIFSHGPTGDGVFIPRVPGQFRTDSYFIFFVVTFLPVIIVLITNFFLIRKHRQAYPEISNRISK